MPPGASRDGGDKKSAASRWDAARFRFTWCVLLAAFAAKEDAEAAETQQGHRRRLGNGVCHHHDPGTAVSTVSTVISTAAATTTGVK